MWKLPIDIIEVDSTDIYTYSVTCGVCGWEGSRIDTAIEMESDGWENPDYPVDICPKCGGILEEYWCNESSKK